MDSVEFGAFDPAGKVALVTGATRGIGREIALRLGKAGATVVIVGRSSADHPSAHFGGTLEQVVDEMGAIGATARPIRADLSRQAEVEETARQVIEWFGGCSIIVNNAAALPSGTIVETSARLWAVTMQVNVVAPAQLAAAFTPGMIERGSGRIVSIGSLAAHKAVPRMTCYGASKLALERLTLGMHQELEGTGVAVSCMRIDASIPTEMWYLSKSLPGAVDGTGPLQSLTSPAEVAGAVEWMIRQPASYSGTIAGLEELRQAGALPVSATRQPGPEE